MDILLVMCIGVLVGKFLIPGKAKTANEYLSFVLCFLMINRFGMEELLWIYCLLCASAFLSENF